jgi:hypothetical protein
LHSQITTQSFFRSLNKPDAVKNTKGATAALRPRICHAFQSSASRPPHSRIRRLPAEKAAPHGQPSRATAAARSARLSAAREAAASHPRPALWRACSCHSFHAADPSSAGQAPRIIRPCRNSTARCSHRSAARAQDHSTRCATPCHKPCATAHHRSRFHSRTQAPAPSRPPCGSTTSVQSSEHANRSAPQATCSSYHATNTGCGQTNHTSSTFSASNAAAESPQPRGCSHRDARRRCEKCRR